jgi:hypothetical protein
VSILYQTIDTLTFNITPITPSNGPYSVDCSSFDYTNCDLYYQKINTDIFVSKTYQIDI